MVTLEWDYQSRMKLHLGYFRNQTGIYHWYFVNIFTGFGNNIMNVKFLLEVIVILQHHWVENCCSEMWTRTISLEISRNFPFRKNYTGRLKWISKLILLPPEKMAALTNEIRLTFLIYIFDGMVYLRVFIFLGRQNFILPIS